MVPKFYLILEKLLKGPLSNKNYKSLSLEDMKKLVISESESYANGLGKGTPDQFVALTFVNKVKKLKSVNDVLLAVSEEYFKLLGMTE